VLLSCGRHVHIRSSCRTLGCIRLLQLSFKGAILAVLAFVFGLAISCGRNVLYCPLARLQLRAGTQLQLTSIPAKRTFVDYVPTGSPSLPGCVSGQVLLSVLDYHAVKYNCTRVPI
jgi:hypothetical protein